MLVCTENSHSRITIHYLLNKIGISDRKIQAIALVILSLLAAICCYMKSQYQPATVDIDAETFQTALQTIEQIPDEVPISDATKKHVQSSMEGVLEYAQNSGIKFYSRKYERRIFSLFSVPDLILKIKTSGEKWTGAESPPRYKHMSLARGICKKYGLNLLVIPKATMFKVEYQGETYRVIAEQKLDINPEVSVQETYYQELPDPTLRQLITFIGRSGFSGVTWGHLPLVGVERDQVALVDLEEMGRFEGISQGLFGSSIPLRRGLVRCVSQKQIAIIAKEAKKYVKWSEKNMDRSRRRREVELADDDKLRKFYVDHGICGDQLINIDRADLNFSAYPCSEALTELAIAVTAEINTLIAQSSPQKSLKARRCVLINTNNKLTQLYRQNIAKYSPKDARTCDDRAPLEIVVNKLIDLGCIHSLVYKNSIGIGYLLQV